MRRASVRRGHARAAAAADASFSLRVLIEKVMFPFYHPKPATATCNEARASKADIDTVMTWDPRQRGMGRSVEDIVELQVHTPLAHAHMAPSVSRGFRCTRHTHTHMAPSVS